MGRSVDYLTGATAVVYYDVSEFGVEQQATCEHCGEYYYSPIYDTVTTTQCCDTPLTYQNVISEDLSQVDWEWFVSNITDTLTQKFPSLSPCSRWDGREVHIFLESSQLEFGISEYCGLASLSVRSKDQYPANLQPLADRNALKAGQWLESHMGDLRTVGRFSNGEHVLERKHS